jgi:2-polyprenyl-3-methyl-5-hydroxy-6-metoxy-1,4-benzoquinol methylase
VVKHYQAVAEGYGSRYDTDALLTRERYSANLFRLNLLVDCLKAAKASRVFEVGVGDGIALALMAKAGFEVSGCDIAPAMVEQAKATLAREKLDPARCFLGDVERIDTILAQARPAEFDAVVAAGVLPHVADDLAMLRNIRALLRRGGKALIEFRNKLFSLFTFNRHTRDFILDDLLAGVDPRVTAAVREEIERRCAMDQPAARLARSDGSPDYDAIRAAFHNPFELPSLFGEAGLRHVRVHWYHFHAAPPLAEPRIGRTLFRSESMRMEGRTGDWRGMFLCSAGVVEADAV